MPTGLARPQQAQAGATDNAVVSTQPLALPESELQKHAQDAGQKQQQKQQQPGMADMPAATSASSDAGHSTQTPVHKQQHASSTAPAGPEGHAEDPPLPPTEIAQHKQEPAKAGPQPATEPLPQQDLGSQHGPSSQQGQSRSLQDNSAQQDTTSLQEERQEQPQQPHRSRGLQPQDLSSVLAQLSDNAEAIAAAEEVLEGLLLRQATLHQLGRKMEQHQVLPVLQSVSFTLLFIILGC